MLEEKKFNKNFIDLEESNFLTNNVQNQKQFSLEKVFSNILICILKIF